MSARLRAGIGAICLVLAAGACSSGTKSSSSTSTTGRTRAANDIEFCTRLYDGAKAFTGFAGRPAPDPERMQSDVRALAVVYLGAAAAAPPEMKQAAARLAATFEGLRTTRDPNQVYAISGNADYRTLAVYLATKCGPIPGREATAITTR